MNKKQWDRQLVDNSICGLESRLEKAFQGIKDINGNLNEAIREQNNKHQMLLDYLKLEEKEYAVLEEEEFATYKGLAEILETEMPTRAVKKTKLVKKK